MRYLVDKKLLEGLVERDANMEIQLAQQCGMCWGGVVSGAVKPKNTVGRLVYNKFYENNELLGGFVLGDIEKYDCLVFNLIFEEKDSVFDRNIRDKLKQILDREAVRLTKEKKQEIMFASQMPEFN